MKTIPWPLLSLLWVAGCAGSADRLSPTSWFDSRPRTAAEAELEQQTARERIKKIDAIANSSTGSVGAVASLTQQIQSENDPLVRRAIVRALANFDSVQSRAVLQAALNDADTNVRIAACDAWGKLGGIGAANALGTALGSDTNLDVRIAAARGLGKLNATETRSLLATALEDEDPALQLTALESLEAVSGQRFDNNVNQALQYARSGVAAPDTSIASRLSPLR